MAQIPVAELIYDAFQQLLSGKIGNGPNFHMTAYSGGSRGHSAGANAKIAALYRYQEASMLKSHWANTPEKDKNGRYEQRGGPLPAGHYDCQYITHHTKFGECIQLHRRSDAMAIYSPFSPRPIPHHRGDDFFIHGRGVKGSDGCIVPANPAERRRLNHAVRDFRGKVALLVRNVPYVLPAELEGQFA